MLHRNCVIYFGGGEFLNSPFDWPETAHVGSVSGPLYT